MKMRLKPVRGQKWKWDRGNEVVVLEEVGEEMVSVILSNGKTANVLKNELALPIIETKDYEKIT